MSESTGIYFAFQVKSHLQHCEVVVDGDFDVAYGFKLKQAPSGYVQFQKIGFNNKGQFEVVIRAEHPEHGHANHIFQLQLKSHTSPAPKIKDTPSDSVIERWRGESEWTPY